MARSRKGTHMYKTILVTLDRTAADRAIIEHIKGLAKAMQSRVVLLHVATGALAKYHGKNAAGSGGRRKPGVSGPHPGRVCRCRHTG
jgi:hypothetical protein